jgi:hypothetical protein
MIVRFTKGGNKPDALTCIRDDGSQTWSPVGAGVGVVHDFTHYAVETTLGCTEAFYAMVAAGRDIESFGTKNGRKDVYPVEAIQVEHLVGLLQLSFVSGNPFTTPEILDLLAAESANSGIPMSDLTDSQIDAAREKFQTLFARWSALAPGESIDLPFPA